MAKVTLDIGRERILLVLFLLSSAVYFLSTSGFFGSNPGAHYALVRSIAENQTFKINSYKEYTGFIDYAQYNDDFFSDRAPGTSFVTTPFYIIGKISSKVFNLPAYYRGMNAGNPAGLTTLLMPAFAGAIVVLMCYLISLELGASNASSAIAALAAGFGTILWKYSTSLYSHSLSAALATSAVWLAISLKDMKKERLKSILLFFILGFQIVVEYPNVILSAIIGVYLLTQSKIKLSDIMKLKKEIITPVLISMLALSLIPFYNLVNFDNPLHTAYRYAPHHPWVADLSDALSTPWSEGIPGLLVSHELVDTQIRIEGGLLIMSPFLILSLWGLMYLLRDKRPEGLLLAGLFIAHLLFYSKYKTWSGGGVSDTRYLLTVIPLAVIPLSIWRKSFLEKLKSETARTFADSLMWVLIFMSILNVAADVATFEGYGYKLFTYPATNLDTLSVSLNSLFPNISRLPFFVGSMAILYSLTALVRSRFPGLEPSKKKAKGFNPTLLAPFAIGIIIIIIYGAIPDYGGLVFTDWKFSVDGFDFRDSSPPFSVDKPRLFVRGTMYIKGPFGNPNINIAAKDCIQNIIINDRPLPLNLPSCTECRDCGGSSIDVDKLLRWKGVQHGQNTISFEILGLGNQTELNLLPQKSG